MQALIERRDALLPELDAELAKHQSALDRKWGRLQALRRKMEVCFGGGVCLW